MAEEDTGTRSAGPAPLGSVIGAERIVVRPSRSFAPADDPAASPVTNAKRPDVTADGWSGTPPLDESLAGCRGRSGPDAGAVSVPSGLTVQPRATSKSSSNAPQRTRRTDAPSTASGHQAALDQPQDGLLVAPGLGRDHRVFG